MLIGGGSDKVRKKEKHPGTKTAVLAWQQIGSLYLSYLRFIVCRRFSSSSQLAVFLKAGNTTLGTPARGCLFRLTLRTPFAALFPPSVQESSQSRTINQLGPLYITSVHHRKPLRFVSPCFLSHSKGRGCQVRLRTKKGPSQNYKLNRMISPACQISAAARTWEAVSLLAPAFHTSLATLTSCNQ
jgi:hypothetical protein